MLRVWLETFDSIGRLLVSIPAALLPRQVWRGWDGPLPMARGAVLSALLTFAAAFAVGLPAFLRDAGRTGAQVSSNIILTGHAVNTGRAPVKALPGSFAVSMLSFPAFVLFTPMGWLSSYLFLTGLYRALASATGEHCGDPLLTLAVARAGTALRSRRERRAAEALLEQEGPEVPDVLLAGREAGAPEAELAVVSARVKRGWSEGTFVTTADEWFRLGAPFDRRYAGALRHVYPLIRPAQAEVMRRRVAYELPPLSAAYPSRPLPPPT